MASNDSCCAFKKLGLFNESAAESHRSDVVTKALFQRLSLSKSPDLERKMYFVNTHVLHATLNLQREKELQQEGAVEGEKEIKLENVK